MIEFLPAGKPATNCPSPILEVSILWLIPPILLARQVNGEHSVSLSGSKKSVFSSFRRPIPGFRNGSDYFGSNESAVVSLPRDPTLPVAQSAVASETRFHRWYSTFQHERNR